MRRAATRSSTETEASAWSWFSLLSWQYVWLTLLVCGYVSVAIYAVEEVYPQNNIYNIVPGVGNSDGDKLTVPYFVIMVDLGATAVSGGITVIHDTYDNIDLGLAVIVVGSLFFALFVFNFCYRVYLSFYDPSHGLEKHGSVGGFAYLHIWLNSIGTGIMEGVLVALGLWMSGVYDGTAVATYCAIILMTNFTHANHPAHKVVTFNHLFTFVITSLISCTPFAMALVSLESVGKSNVQYSKYADTRAWTRALVWVGFAVHVVRLVGVFILMWRERGNEGVRDRGNVPLLGKHAKDGPSKKFFTGYYIAAGLLNLGLACFYAWYFADDDGDVAGFQLHGAWGFNNGVKAQDGPRAGALILTFQWLNAVVSFFYATWVWFGRELPIALFTRNSFYAINEVGLSLAISWTGISSEVNELVALALIAFLGYHLWIDYNYASEEKKVKTDHGLSKWLRAVLVVLHLILSAVPMLVPMWKIMEKGDKLGFSDNLYWAVVVISCIRFLVHLIYGGAHLIAIHADKLVEYMEDYHFFFFVPIVNWAIFIILQATD